MSTLKNVYTPEEFAKEILCEHRSAKWVRAQCKAKKIKTVTSRPFLIPQLEAMRFLGQKAA
jgi:hypothetical protein